MIYFFSIIIVLIILAFIFNFLKKRKKPQSLSEVLDSTGFVWVDLDVEGNKYKHLQDVDVKKEYFILVNKAKLKKSEKTKLMAFKDLMEKRDLF